MHFVGVGGAGMSGYARAAHALGAEVTGSDGALSPYAERLQADGVLEVKVAVVVADCTWDWTGGRGGCWAVARRGGSRISGSRNTLSDVCSDLRIEFGETSAGSLGTAVAATFRPGLELHRVRECQRRSGRGRTLATGF